MNEKVTDDLKRDDRPVAYADKSDHPQFSQPIETVKNAFVQELRDFFDQQRTKGFLTEVPTITKYAAPQRRDDRTGVDPLETAVNLLRAFPDINQMLPLVAVTTATGRERKLGLNGFIGHTQQPCRVTGNKAGPYLGLFAGGAAETLTVETEDPEGAALTSTWTFTPSLFSDPTAVTIDEMVATINAQALYARAHRVPVRLSNPFEEDVLDLRVGGPLGQVRPNHIKVLSGSTALLTALGLSVGQEDNSDNPARPPCLRFGMATDLTVGIDVGAEDDNVRTELSDLVINFGSLFFDRRNYQLLGRGVFDERYPLEHTQIVIQGPLAVVGEADLPRPAPEGEALSKIYVNRFNLPVTVLSYIDRQVTAGLPQTFTDVTGTGVEQEVPLPN